ncbi:hypothetical protein EJ02DRAFT_424478 [Clathrospora elynae]|uniref:Uncharacterized protein n=1 Tax=Clathrospora elynae TaxID=706981 RepID=A0A6A5SJS8_9PLEO|nr:hypothetical protein EJ02DRAFT_424478 [Clathrospora elynae]
MKPLIFLIGLVAFAAASPLGSTPKSSSLPTPMPKLRSCNKMCAPTKIKTCGEGWQSEKTGVSHPSTKIYIQARGKRGEPRDEWTLDSFADGCF